MTINRSKCRVTPSLRSALQLSMTHETTMRHALELFEQMCIRGALYSYRARNPSKHLPAWYLHVARLLDINIAARVLLPYSITKYENWKLILEFTNSRLSYVDIIPSGRLARGGNIHHGFTEYEVSLAERLHVLNLRGRSAVARESEWQAKLTGIKVSK